MAHSGKLGLIAELLVQHGAEVSGASVIHAAYVRDIALLRVLIQSGAPINDRDERGRTPLILAAGFGDLEVVEFLLRHGIDACATDAAGLNAADWSVVGGFPAVTQRLEAAGVRAAKPDIESPPRAKASTFTERASGTVDTYMVSGLIHVTASGVRVRSKSEVVIADTLFHMGTPFEYELPFIGTQTRGLRLPDFTIRRVTGQLILWEHLGMLHDAGYKASWSRKLAWYKQNCMVEGESLFVTHDDPRGGLDSRTVNDVAQKIQARVREVQPPSS